MRGKQPGIRDVLPNKEKAVTVREELQALLAGHTFKRRGVVMKALSARVKIDLPASLERPVAQIRLLKDEGVEAFIKATERLKFFTVHEEVSPLHHERGLPHYKFVWVFVFGDPETSPLPLSYLHPIKILSRAVLDPVDRHSEGVRPGEVLMEGTKKSFRELHVSIEEKENVAGGETGCPITGAREAEVFRILLNAGKIPTEALQHCHALIF